MKVSQSRLTLRPHGLYSPWNSLGQNTGVGSFSLLQGIFLTQGSNPGLPHWRQILYQLSHKGSLRILEWIGLNKAGLSILKSRDITLPTKVRLVKAMVFPVVMYGCESWTVKKAERQRIDAFELWCWRRLLRVPWTPRRSNQSILKEISPGCSLECWNSNTLATSCKELTHWKRLWCWEGLGAGGKGDDRGWDGWMASSTRWTWVWVSSRSWWWTGRPGVLRFMGSQRVGHDWASELSWTELPKKFLWKIWRVGSIWSLLVLQNRTIYNGFWPFFSNGWVLWHKRAKHRRFIIWGIILYEHDLYVYCDPELRARPQPLIQVLVS